MKTVESEYPPRVEDDLFPEGPQLWGLDGYQLSGFCDVPSLWASGEIYFHDLNLKYPSSWVRLSSFRKLNSRNGYPKTSAISLSLLLRFPFRRGFLQGRFPSGFSPI